MPFGEYELSPSLIGLSLLHSAHPEAFQRLLVRTSIPCYRDFILAKCRSIYNSEGKSDYESGFQPAYSGYVVNEMSDMSRFLPFGDTNEALLSTALGAIDGSIQPPAQEDTRSLRVTTLANSIERRASHAVRIK